VVQRVIVADIATGSQTVLFSRVDTDRRYFVVVGGQINGQYAVWSTILLSRTGLLGGDVWLHDLATSTTTKISAGRSSWEYGASVSGDGTVYFGRSPVGCGQDAQVVARALDGSETVLYTVPAGRDFNSTFAGDEAGGTTDVLFDLGNCDGTDIDIWRFDNV
jgi:hypothetical protein